MATGDMREDVLARIFVIMQSMTGITSTVRNRGLLTNEKRPAQVLLDGDELPRLSIDTARIKGLASLLVPQIIQMRPEVYYLPTEKRPTNVNPTDAKNIGTEANEWRIAFLAKLWGDVELADILGANGSMVYNGCETDMKSGSAMSGEIKLDFIINAVLKPTA